ncbi:hypothetical protein KVT40_003104 [Elsinoe batatas]|uniref:Uncharacterized protein n=1 Tax=Elsinoe batatas TaxID=2601811 RepID=A0A8K0L3X4_9PEZI|nr:hypothetical protein KVT40_003104 [Elsinoe batatas]
MFSERWNVGEIFSAESPKAFHCPNDDPISMEILLRVLHLKIGLDKRFMPITAGHGFTIVCDKYDCAAAVSFVAEMWLAANLATAELNYGEMEYLLVVALFFDTRAHAESLLSMMTVKTAEPVLDSVTRDDSMLSVSTLVTIHKHREEMKATIKEALKEVVDGPKKCRCHYMIKAKDVLAVYHKVDTLSVEESALAAHRYLHEIYTHPFIDCGRQNHSPKERRLNTIAYESITKVISIGKGSKMFLEELGL